MLRLWQIILFLMTSQNVIAEEKVITFNMTSDGYPPYMMYGKDTHPSGIMYDVLHLILTKQGYVLDTRSVPKKRELTSFNNQQIDAHAMIRELVDDPDQYEFSDPVLKIRNVLFTLRDSPIIFTKLEDLIGKKAITHLGYKYPVLEGYFRKGLIERYDTVNEEAMLSMVLLKRGDFTIVNEYVGTWIIQQNKWEGKFVASPKNLTSYDYRIMFSKKWKLLVTEFNKELALMKENGLLENIINKYLAFDKPNQ